MAQSNENYAEALKKLATQIAQASLLPDADMEFSTQLLNVIRTKIMGTYMQAAQLGPQPGAGPVAQDGSVPSMGMGPGEPTPMGPGGAAGGGMGGMTTPPNADELRRVLAG